MAKIPVLVAASAFIIALFLFAWVSDAPAYAGTAPETCNNCHVMEAAYENWYHAPHERWAKCVECHLPHDNLIHYYFEKARTGFHDVYVFSTGTTPVLIRAKENTLSELAGQLGMSEGAVKVAAHRLRGRYRQLLREEIANTVSGPEEVEEELRQLFAALGG